ncbi:uncharacterized protein LOC119110457 [Pollicipes pollicipes]|uniref:uncharacterized protein LOC119110457 n=1 Tax=Pollicipes pollicipes TaxID=41117 RepID=UPI001884DA53|nr:uncharacterized protein LOC119110457 [Pollicipes pollicipes]
MNLNSDEDMTASNDELDSDAIFIDSSISSLANDAIASDDMLGGAGCRVAGAGRDAATPTAGPASHQRRRLRDPPWLEGVEMTCELINRYQMEPRNLEEVLERDRQALQHMPQPATLSEQLSQLYQDLETAGAPPVINLGEREGTSGSSDDSATVLSKRLKLSRRLCEYDRLAIIFDEDSPIPPPDLPACHPVLQST